MSSFSNIFLNVTKAFLNTNPSIDNVIAFANVDDMLIPLEINQTQINMSKPPNVPHDKFAALFLPEELQNYTCGYASPDGSCLFNSVSIILRGDESVSLDLRAATISDLMKHADYYLRLPIFQSDWAWSNEAMLAENDANEKYIKAAYYKMELKHMCSPNSYSPLLALYGLSGVIKKPIQ